MSSAVQNTISCRHLHRTEYRYVKHEVGICGRVTLVASTGFLVQPNFGYTNPHSYEDYIQSDDSIVF